MWNPDWVELKDNAGKYAGEAFLEMTFYPIQPAVVRILSLRCPSDRHSVRLGASAHAISLFWSAA